METSTNYTPVLTSKIRMEAMGSGHLKVHQAVKDGEVVTEVFTLESLAHVLDLPMSTMDGRYTRAGLSRWMVPIVNGYGRPARGFPYALLQEVITLVTTPGAKLEHDVNGSGPASKRIRQEQDLRPEYFEGQKYFTVPALSDAFGYSETTIRKKLQRAGLMSKFRDLQGTVYGGRPKRGINEKHLGEIKLAIENAASFVDGVTRVMRDVSAHAAARDEMRSRIMDHEPPVPNSLRAWDRDTMAPAKPVNTVKPDPVADDFAAEIAFELENLVLPGTTQPQEPEAGKPASPDLALVQTQDQTASPPDGEFGQRMFMQRMHRDALIQSDVEPTDDELADTVEMLELDKAAADRFVQEVKLARQHRGNA